MSQSLNIPIYTSNSIPAGTAIMVSGGTNTVYTGGNYVGGINTSAEWLGYTSINGGTITSTPVTTGTCAPNSLIPSYSWVLPDVPKIKLCRECDHAHVADQEYCIVVAGYSAAITECQCKEYKPKDNLEYLEWKYKKKRLELDK